MYKQDALRISVGKLIMDKPLFSDRWMNLDAMAQTDWAASGEGIAVHAHAASERRNILKNLFQSPTFCSRMRACGPCGSFDCP